MKKFEHLGSSVMHWLRSRGLFQQPDLTAEQVFQLEECFHIFDADESGTVDIDEILAAMSLLGLPAERKVKSRRTVHETRALLLLTICLHSCLRLLLNRMMIRHLAI